MKKVVCLLSIVCFLSILPLNTAQAQSGGWYNVNVAYFGVGGADGYTYAALSDYAGAFGDTVFIAEPTMAKEMLSLLIAARTNNLHVCVLLSGIAQGSTISVMYLLPW